MNTPIPDSQFVGLPWKFRGRDRAGLDCVGLAKLWLTEQTGMRFVVPSEYSASTDAEKIIKHLPEVLKPHPSHPSSPSYSRGDIVFFRDRSTKRLRHVAVYLGDEKYLHILKGITSRIERTTRLMERIGLEPVGAISCHEIPALQYTLADPNLGDPTTWVLIGIAIVSLALSAAAAFLLRPKLGQNRNQTGRYGFDDLVTQTSSELPLPDVLGRVVLAGNSPYQTIIDRSQTVTDQTLQKANKIIVLASGPINSFFGGNYAPTINGTAWNNPYFYDDNPDRGLALDPAQTKAEAVAGTIGSDSNRPSFSQYLGAHAVSIARDVRADYDRGHPIYGFSGAAYLNFRLINTEKFPTFNLNLAIEGRLFRRFTSAGFTTATITNESHTGTDGVKVRFKLAFSDIKSVAAVTVNATTYTEYGPASNTGNVYAVNKTKGYIEFLTAPASGTTVLVTYTYYPRSWSQNPAVHLVYLLTEPLRGKGFPENKINFFAADALQQYCDDTVNWTNTQGSYSGPRYTSNYVLDARKPIQDHIRAVLDACYGYLFISQGQIVMKPRKAESAVFDFDASNILAGSFSSERIDRSDRANRVHVFFRPTDTLNAETEVIRDDPTDQAARCGRIGNAGIVETTLHLPAIDNQPQAERYGETILREEVNLRWTCQFTTTILGIALEPGDVVTVTHPAQPAWTAKPFRIEQISYDAQDRLTLQCSEYFAGAYI